MVVQRHGLICFAHKPFYENLNYFSYCSHIFRARKQECLFLFIPFFVFGFWSLLARKLQKYYVIFVYILQGKMGKTEKNQKEDHATKVTKIPKTKRPFMG